MTEPTKFKCPDCDAVFTDPRSLGPHRNKAHGYRVSDGRNHPSLKQGTKPTGFIKKTAAKPKHVAASAIDKNRGSFPCPQCDFVASWTGGLKLHTRMKHKSEIERSTALVTSTASEVTPIARANKNGHVSKTDLSRSADAPEALIAFTAGRVQELCSVAASQFDLPSKPFTARVIELIYATTLR